MSANRAIGGVLDLATLDLLAGRDRHRPQDAATVRVAIHELCSRGLGDYDIAAVTGVSIECVRRVLGEPKA